MDDDRQGDFAYRYPLANKIIGGFQVASGLLLAGLGGTCTVMAVSQTNVELVFVGISVAFLAAGLATLWRGVVRMRR